MNRDARPLIVVLTLLVGAGADAAQQRAASSAGLKIVVIEGEDAINIIQQKTAVAPLVEVRDRNDVPVPGAVVTFTIGGGKTAAFAGGSQTLTVTTNAAGRAVAALNPLTNGTVQIQVSAAFQGQTAVATIAQTNVLSAAEASAASGAASGGGSSAATAGTAGGAGGGMSATTVGIVAGAVGGGALATATALDVFKGSTVYSGEISGQIEETVTNTQGGRAVFVCVNTDTFAGTIKITLEEQDGVKGELEIKGTSHRVGSTCPSPARPDQSDTVTGPVTGTTGNITFEHTETSTAPVIGAVGTVTSTDVAQFTGSLSGDVISGTLSHSSKTVGVVEGGSGFVAESSNRIPVTLRKAQ